MHPDGQVPKERRPAGEQDGKGMQLGEKRENLFLFTAPDDFIQVVDERILRFRTFIAKFEMVQESRDIPSFIGSYSQFDGIASAYEIEHMMSPPVFSPDGFNTAKSLR
jgi:hypothetical protein